jgi:hypothetical protein
MTRAGKEEELRRCLLENLHILVFDDCILIAKQGSDVSVPYSRIKALAKESALL